MSIRATAPMSDLGSCYHCGDKLPPQGHFRARIAGAERAVCCAGCQAVAEAIAGAGLGAYYERRSNPGRSAAVVRSAVDQDLSVLDSPAYRQAVVQPSQDGMLEVSLLLEGVTCAACIWLIERRLQALEGVHEASVNFSTQRAYVRWDDSAIRLSAIVAAIRAIGYDAEPFDPRRSDAKRRRDSRTSLWRLFVAAFGMMQVMMYAVPAYLSNGDMTADIEGLMRWASLLLTLPVIGFSSVPFFSGALRDLRARTVGMDVPVALAIIVASVASFRATFSGVGEVYFDSITMFVFLLLAARHIEGMLRARAGEATERLGRLLPAVASRLESTADGEISRRVAVAELVPGDRVAIAAGEVVPADGLVESGASEVDESLLTGESRRVSKSAGAALTGGSVNMASRLVMVVRQVGADTVVAGIGRLLDRASLDRPRLAQLADRIAAGFVAVILLIAVAAGVAWWFIDPSRAVAIAVTVLVITCPCALSLATPAALAAATGSLTRLGVLITRGHALETLARATHFVFDKTGTLTAGELEIVRVITLGSLDSRASLAIAAGMERDSRHPLARAFSDRARQQACEAEPNLRDTLDVTGAGIEGTLHGRRIRIGRLDFVGELSGAPLPPALEGIADHVQVVALGDEAGWIALFTLSDKIRPQARALIDALRAEGREVWLLTGDRAGVAYHTAGELGIERVRAQARPEDKYQFVRELQAAGAVVAMVGDGVNDAPVLAQAQVSVAMGAGADIARSSADVILADSALGRLHDSIMVARKTDRIIKENLAWATLYNVIAVPAAVAGIVTPLMASVGMALSSIIVVLNALRAAHPALWRSVAERPAAVTDEATTRAPVMNSA